MNKLDNAKSTLWHYFELIARKSGTNLDSDCRTEIEGIIDDIVESINAVPVVRCGMCEWKPKCIHHKESEGGIFSDSDFCSYGERRTE